MNEELQTLVAEGRIAEALARVRLAGEGPREALEALERIRLSLRMRDAEGARAAAEAGRQALAELIDVEELERALADLAEERFEDWLAHPVVGAEAWVQKGLLDVAEGRLADARDAFAEAARRDRQHWRALTNLGNAELELGNLDAAEAAYAEAVKANENYPEVYQGMAALEKRRGRIDRMVRLLKKAQKMRLRPREEQVPGAVLPPRRARAGALFSWRNRWWIWIALILLAYWWTRR
ncbi:Tetratricopeptide TPR_1 repeat-containing protein [Oceanithermus profundus DSM 14977]|uniref:Tetratricopeptide TPR_1 repeat-containing protein n=1 Tax=Oceanithermus profundus (strain DSM 14977 / NBRC 100410 / VKM B-2274 / 506) TaxID=670487 RepID=E4U698_OCEP5|nr:tetratricopeptide repeat protein [Oceanithermus profundus]ADR35518.1 Tetratricopeptide TPR_1 repeat-containing protein [Oceanithermus profundus DSM 14977]